MMPGEKSNSPSTTPPSICDAFFYLGMTTQAMLWLVLIGPVTLLPLVTTNFASGSHLRY